MEPNINNSNKTDDLLKVVEKVSVGARNSEFSKEFLKKNNTELTKLSEFLGISNIQTAIFCVVLNLNFGKSCVDLDEIAGYIGCSPISVLGYLPELDELVNARIIRRHARSSKGRKLSLANINGIEFYANREVLDSLRLGTKFGKKAVEITDVHALLAHLIEVYSEYDDGDFTYDELIREVKDLMFENNSLSFVTGLDKYSLSDENLLFFLLVCNEFIDNNETIDLVQAIKYLYPDLSQRMRVRKEFLRGSHTLIKVGLVKIEEGHFRSDKTIALTDKGIELILQDDKDLFVAAKEKKSKYSGITASSIAPKELYFSSKEAKSLDFLTETLKPENHTSLVQRMKEAGMRTGIAVLLYGPPGTGKTESVYQLARKTGRDIHMISISETKSMWFGESEKLIKRVFDEYRIKVEKSKVTPILLFNEADGIFSSRKKTGASSVDQTENAIQNIILQEMEDLQGILIATTNLTQNLDQAFERRFLYKICFEKPDVEAMARIWQDKVKELPAGEVYKLATAFELSGGQIENIARKCLLHQLLYAVFPALAEIESFCQEEQINRNSTPQIGYIRVLKALKVNQSD